ncbi:MAG: DUF2125 domain-containing protein [Alphaproteobacteria bacterium]
MSLTNRYVILFGALGLAFAGYAIWWFNQAGSVPDRVETKIASAMPASVAVTMDAGDVSGFPFRIVTDLDAVALEIEGVGRFETAFAYAVMQPFNDGHIVLSFPEPVTYRLADGSTGTITAARALGSLTGFEQGAPKVDLDSKDLVLQTGNGTEMTATRFGLHLQGGTPDQPVLDVALSSRGLAQPDPETGIVAELRAAHAKSGKGLDLTARGGVINANDQPLTPAQIDALISLF